MANRWPDNNFNDSEVSNVFQLAQTFELHCAQVYEHAASHPEDAASAEYVMQLALQAYRTVHSLHMQKLESSYWDLSTATAQLESKISEFHKERKLPSSEHISPLDEHLDTVSPPLSDQINGTPDSTLGRVITSEYDDDDDDDESDSDWEESKEESDDDYYEYNEGSDCDSELDIIMEADEVDIVENSEAEEFTKNPAPEVSNGEEIEHCTEDKEAQSPVPALLDQAAMHDRITAALRAMAIKEETPDRTPQTQPETHADDAKLYTVPTSTDDGHSEATTVRLDSNPAESLKTSTTLAGVGETRTNIDVTHLHRKLSAQTTPKGTPRRLKTVCYKYIRKAMVPIRGQAH
ncbi:uncharacterized protein N7483_002995 [Penicillium malachiteum]|uniref:uncharacterized protein n=1 Tax=Penicillium malachiteum TaxID=1324776 RepID=UPI002547556C|nr:uncharacterized protein N7483_002995 [Penicillium malachiteum]KAJ5737870.1 hypothetical protein N7483_002995 [Penicillium malachiteum]